MGQAQAGNAEVVAIWRVLGRSRANTAVERHLITGIGREGKDSDVIVVGSAFILPRAHHYLQASRQFASQLDLHEPIGLQERLEGRSSHNREFLRDVS